MENLVHSLKSSWLLFIPVVQTLASISLFVAGMFVPWIAGRDSLGSYHYNLYRVCRHTETACKSWSQHVADDSFNKPYSKQQTGMPSEVASTLILLSMEGIALLVSLGLYLWCACVTPNVYWAKNAMECAVSSMLYATVGILLFFCMRMSKEPNGSLMWGAALIIATLGTQAMVVLTTFMLIRRHKLTTPPPSELDLPTCQSVVNHSVKAAQKQQRAGSRNHSPEHSEIEKKSPIVKDATSPASPRNNPAIPRNTPRNNTDPDHNRGPELLRMVQVYQQANRKKSSRPFGSSMVLPVNRNRSFSPAQIDENPPCGSLERPRSHSITMEMNHMIEQLRRTSQSWGPSQTIMQHYDSSSQLSDVTELNIELASYAEGSNPAQKE